MHHMQETCDIVEESAELCGSERASGTINLPHLLGGTIQK